jgi:signal transduction histidine kinase
MLDISRISLGKLFLQLEEVDIGELVRDVIDRFDEQIKATGSSYRLIVEGSVVGCWDHYRIEQVVTNLITNAMKYGEGKPIEISVAAHRDIALLTVRDQGLGIAQDNLDRIFQRFERAITVSSISGLGLGLYISKQIVEAHHGVIRVQSKLGEGSEFIVELPLIRCSNSDR